jgi:MoaA/NifB/PqqE/SkfB family radical SAM enzyme/TusA-related sulfurtransferase
MVKNLVGIQKDLFMMKMIKRKEIRDLGPQFLMYLRSALKHEKFVEIDGKVVLNSQMPPYGTEAYDRFIGLSNQVKQGKTAPISCHISVTQKCNLSCWHCSNWHREPTPDLSLEVLEDTIHRLQDMGNCLIGFTGGEPTLRDDLEDIVKCVGPKSSTLLFTNGVGIDEDRAKDLKKAGLFSVSVSLDHHTAAVHDQRRGAEGSFDTAVSAVKSCLDAGLYTLVGTVPTKEMIQAGEVPAFYDFCAGLGAHEVRVLAPIPTGRIVGQRECRWCGTEEEQQMYDYHVKLNQIKDYPRISVYSFLEKEDLLGCTSGTFHIFIESDGTVTPCDMIPMDFGNIQVEGIEECYRSMTEAFKAPRYNCYVRAAVGLFEKGFKEEGKLPFSKERTKEITEKMKNRRLPMFFKKLGMPEPAMEGKKPKEPSISKLDMRGIECPEPVFRTQEKIWEMHRGTLEVLVSEQQAVHNVTETAKREGWSVDVDQKDEEEFLITLRKA